MAKKIFLLKILFITVTLIVSLANTVSAKEETAIASNISITENTVWSGTVMIDEARVTVGQGATLTLAPGTVVAGKNGGSLFIEGKLKALGEEDRKVRFTSEYDENFNYSLTYSIN